MRKERVAIGMSGGVDSSVAALLLKQQGYDVVGFFLKFWYDPSVAEAGPSCPTTRDNACCDEAAFADASRVAKKLGIPLYKLDARKEFKQMVADEFISEYRNCRTPNPCVRCNEHIKFGWMLERARATGIESIATGHYAKIVNGRLYKAKDKDKDQTYFLYRLSADRLHRIEFPLGDLTKAEVRKIAEDNDLGLTHKKESQEICFVQDEDYRAFLRRNLGERGFEPGKIIDVRGIAVGEHNGLPNYTIGQRRGIDQKLTKNANKSPLYVIAKNQESNSLVVGSIKDIEKAEIEFENAIIDENYIGARLTAKIRYRAKEASCVIKKTKHGYTAKFDEPQFAPAPGQHLVLYREDEVIGGGIIQL